MKADPVGFSQLIGLLIDRRIKVTFTDGRMRCRAPRGAVDAEVRRLLQRFRESLRQAWGPERLAREVD